MNTEKTTDLRGLFRIGGIAAILQLVVTLTYSVLYGALGAKPTTAQEYFDIFMQSPAEAFFRGDFLLLILIGLYIFTAPAMFAALRKKNFTAAFFATIFSIIVVITTFATESSIGLYHLGKEYLTADAAQRASIVVTGEAIMAMDMWHTSAAYMAGILLQGAGVIFSLIMWKSEKFSKVTATAGLIGNGLDLIQHVLHIFFPGITTVFQMVMGVFYFVWYPMLGRDLLKLSKKEVE